MRILVFEAAAPLLIWLKRFPLKLSLLIGVATLETSARSGRSGTLVLPGVF